METLKRYTLVTGACVAVTILAAGIDIVTSKDTAKRQDDFRYPSKEEFILTPGFSRQRKTVRTSEFKPESPRTFNLKCIHKDNDQDKIYEDQDHVDIHFNREDKFIIKVDKELTKPINIVVEGMLKESDPVIIIKTLDDRSICQDYERRGEAEKLDANERISKEIWPSSIPRGTYYMWIGDYDYVTTNYTIIISENQDY